MGNINQSGLNVEIENVKSKYQKICQQKQFCRQHNKQLKKYYKDNQDLIIYFLCQQCMKDYPSKGIHKYLNTISFEKLFNQLMNQLENEKKTIQQFINLCEWDKFSKFVKVSKKGVFDPLIQEKKKEFWKKILEILENINSRLSNNNPYCIQQIQQCWMKKLINIQHQYRKQVSDIIIKHLVSNLDEFQNMFQRKDIKQVTILQKQKRSQWSTNYKNQLVSQKPNQHQPKIAEQLNNQKQKLNRNKSPQKLASWEIFNIFSKQKQEINQQKLEKDRNELKLKIQKLQKEKDELNLKYQKEKYSKNQVEAIKNELQKKILQLQIQLDKEKRSVDQYKFKLQRTKKTMINVKLLQEERIKTTNLQNKIKSQEIKISNTIKYLQKIKNISQQQFQDQTIRQFQYTQQQSNQQNIGVIKQIKQLGQYFSKTIAGSITNIRVVQKYLEDSNLKSEKRSRQIQILQETLKQKDYKLFNEKQNHQSILISIKKLQKNSFEQKKKIEQQYISKINVLEKNLSTLESKSSNLNSKFQQQFKKLIMQAQNKKFQSLQQNYKSQIKRLEDQRNKKQQEVYKLNNVIKSLELKLGNSLKQCENIKNYFQLKLQEQKNKYQNLQQQFKWQKQNLQNQIKTLEQSKLESNKRLIKMRSLQNDVNKKNQLLKQSASDISRLKQQLIQQKKKLIQMQKQTQAKQNQLLHKQQEENNIKQQQKNANQFTKESIQEKQKQLNSIKQKYSQLKIECENSNREIATLNKNIEEYKRKQQNINGGTEINIRQIKRLTRELEQRNLTLEQSKRMNTQDKNKISELQRNLFIKSNQVLNFERNLKEHEQKLIVALKNLQQKKKICDSAQSDYLKLKKESKQNIQNLNKDIERLDKQLKANKIRQEQSINKIMQLSKKISELEKDLKNIKQILEKKSMQVLDLQKKLNQSKQQLIRLNNEVKKVNSYEKKIAKLIQIDKISTNLLDESQILVLLQMIKKRIQFTKLQLIFVASQHEFSSQKFHKICDNKPRLVVIAKCMNGKIFGGYCSPGFGEQQENDPSFIFSITHKIDLNLKSGKQSTVCDLAYGPIFGMDSDIRIRQNKATSNYHIYNNSYEKRQDLPVSAKQLVCGARQAEIIDYQVHRLIIDQSNHF